MREAQLQKTCEILLKEGLLAEKQRKEIQTRAPSQRAVLLKRAREESSQLGLRSKRAPEVYEAELIASFGELSEEQVAKALAKALGLSYVKLDPLKLDMNFITRTISGPFAERHMVLPVEKKGETITVALVDPFDKELIENLSRITGSRIEPVLTTKAELLKLITEFYGFRSSITKAESTLSQGIDLGNLEQYVKMKKSEELDATDKPVVNAVWHLFNYAFSQRASDIHVEPKREDSEVRLRIDGVLHPIHRLPRIVHQAVVSRIKMLARMDIAEKRRPQDGRVKTEHEGREVEMRVSTLPVAFGEKVVIRIFDPTVLMQDLESLGFFERELKLFDAFIRRPHGVILVTGPTGSGKTTTLYSALHTIYSPEINITTIEDPIEMVYEEFNQVAVQPKIDMTYANILRTILRQDPDVIMVGEIRDQETAEYAVQAALTGHLVLSTLHTNDTASTVSRLLDLKVPPFLISSTILGIVAQRLVRRICEVCKADAVLAPDQAAVLGFAPERRQGIAVKRGQGCPECRGTGYKGRVAVYELMEVSDAIIRLIHSQSSSSEIKKAALAEGMTTLRQAAVCYMLDGMTTYEEVVSVTSD